MGSDVQGRWRVSSGSDFERQRTIQQGIGCPDVARAGQAAGIGLQSRCKRDAVGFMGQRVPRFSMQAVGSGMQRGFACLVTGQLIPDAIKGDFAVCDAVGDGPHQRTGIDRNRRMGGGVGKAQDKIMGDFVMAQPDQGSALGQKRCGQNGGGDREWRHRRKLAWGRVKRKQGLIAAHFAQNLGACGKVSSKIRGSRGGALALCSEFGHREQNMFKKA